MERETISAVWWVVLVLVIVAYAFLARWALSGVDDDDRPRQVPDQPLPSITASPRDCALLHALDSSAALTLPACQGTFRVLP